jgi:16S rRNA (guanine966-N2)-methyltransferase
VIRVIGGEAKGRKLIGPKGISFRPTTGRVKEFIFSYIGSDIYEARVIDLFSGSGSLGIEALSRGAASVTFVEKNVVQSRMIWENVRLCRFEDRVKVIGGDVFVKMAELHETGSRFDFILADPPFREGLHAKIVEAAGRFPLLDTQGELLIEHEIHDRAEAGAGFQKLRERAFGHCVISIYRSESDSSV